MENRSKLNAVLDKIESELQKVQKAYYKFEDEIPERYVHYGFDNIVGNVNLYDLGWLANNGEKTDILKGVKEMSDYISRCLRALDAYKPDYGLCGWRGFDAESYYPLHSVKCIIKTELMPLLGVA